MRTIITTEGVLQDDEDVVVDVLDAAVLGEERIYTEERSSGNEQSFLSFLLC
jgi:hypothetical protein